MMRHSQASIDFLLGLPDDILRDVIYVSEGGYAGKAIRSTPRAARLRLNGYKLGGFDFFPCSCPGAQEAPGRCLGYEKEE